MKKILSGIVSCLLATGSAAIFAVTAPVSLNIQPESVTVPYGANSVAMQLQFYVVNNAPVSLHLSGFSLTAQTPNSQIVVSSYTNSCNSTLPPQGSTGICNIYANIQATGAQSVGQQIGPFNYTFSLTYGDRKQKLQSQAFPINFADGSVLSVANRTFTFNNYCNREVWIGIASGATNSIKPDPAHPTNLTSCLVPTDCYPGSQCITVNSSLKQCYWLNPAPNDEPGNFKLDAKGGTRTSTTVTFPTYNNGIDVVWTGGLVGRTNCSSGTCDTADCGGTGTGACPIGGSIAPPSTKAEFTLQNQTTTVYTNTPNNNTDKDTYDITLIDGHSLPLSMYPTNGTWGGASFPYTCGKPGSAAASSPLGSCPWTFSPPTNFPTGTSSSHYVWVKSNGSSDCSGCTGGGGGLVCGVSFDKTKPAGTQLKLGCGTFLGYWTADSLCGKDPTNPVVSSFKCGIALQGALTYANLYACDKDELKQSCYTTPVNTCCGCIDWNTLGITIPVPPITQRCTPIPPTPTSPPNPNWTDHAQDTLKWLKTACPTAYVYPYDDASSTFTCSVLNSAAQNVANYTVEYCPENM